MSLARRNAPTQASLLVAGAIFAILFAVSGQPAQAATSGCEEAAGLAVLASPLAPWKGAPLRVVFAAEKPLDGELALIAPDGSVAAKSRDHHDGPPYFWFAEVATPVAGTWHATLTRAGASGDCRTVTKDIVVLDREPPRAHMVPGSVWPIRGSWNRETEDLYSAWIEKLFDDPLDAAPSWPALHEVLRDRSRNFLFDHLGLHEDQIGMIVRPDCADLPYFLRAYFAFKMGLPYGYSKCSRGGGGHGPKCVSWASNQTASSKGPAEAAVETTATTDAATPVPAKPRSLASAFGEYLRVVGDAVHSGSARTALDDNATDYYPVPLTQDTLRPGVVYADPYGHVLMLVRRVPEADGAAGIIFAVDGQPDGTVARKRFWRGNFLYAQNPALGGPGFKRFRPIVRAENGTERRLTNEEIAKNPQYADFSLEQAKMGVEDFYDRMDEVMSPQPLDPLRAMKAAIDALEEQVKARVTSVENGRKYQNSGKAEVGMPAGPSIFETTGAWEDFATPSRDLRLLIAIDVVRNFPDRVARRPQLYAMPAGRSVADVKAQLESVLATELATRKFAYTRSDGSSWPLALKDVIDRQAALEMGYNLNDCVELRWGAPDNSQEAATCRRHAPSTQRSKMTEYRAWFHERRRPPRA